MQIILETFGISIELNNHQTNFHQAWWNETFFMEILVKSLVKSSNIHLDLLIILSL